MDPILAESLFEQAAERARHRVREDQQRVEPRLERILGLIEERLFDHDFSVAVLEREGKLHSKLRKTFRAELGCTPGRYLIERKMETAAWLLRSSELRSWQIAQFLGYARPRTFLRAFKAWSGTTPGDYRNAPAPRRPIKESQSVKSTAFWRRALVGALEPEQGKLLLKRLLRKAGLRETETSTSLVLEIVDGPYTQILAEAVTDSLTTLSTAEQRLAIQDQIRFESPALFYCLSRRSTSESRLDRQRGIAFAELALLTIESAYSAWADVLPGLRALAWARLGNAHRLASDVVNASKCFAEATRCLEKDGASPQYRAEVLSLEASLHIDQRQFRHARHLLDRAIAQCQVANKSRLLVQCLLQRATLECVTGDPTASYPDLHSARHLLAELEEPELELMVAHSLCSAHLLAEDFAAAAKLLDKTLPLCAEHGTPFMRSQLLVVEGMIRHGQGDLIRAASVLKRARSTLVELGELDYLGFASLELALIRFRQQRFSEAVRLASEALPAFRALNLGRDAAAAAEALRLALASESLGETVLVEAVYQLRRLHL